MKNLELAIGMSLGLLLAGCPGDDTGDDGADSGMADSGGTTTTGTPPDDTTGEPPSDTTGEPPDDTTGEPPSDTTGEPPGGSSSGGEAPGMDFVENVYPIIQESCSCHIGGNSGMLPMPDAATAYFNLVGVASSQSPLDRVAPGSPDDSYLWAKLNDRQAKVGGSGQPMPLMSPMLGEVPLGVIEQWILDGAM